jgi:hypothetical protein
MSITENKERIGCFTSSEIHRLMSNDRTGKGIGAPGLSYIEEKYFETKLGRSTTTEAYSQPMAWGQFMEMYVFNLIGTAYEITSKKTDAHPTIKGWSGSKDLIVRGVKVSDIKCYQPLNFARYTDALLSKDLDFIKENFKKEYWQLISNAIINEVPNAEAITFIPYESELEEIREMASNYDGAEQWKYRFIAESDKSSLPYIPNEGYYSNLNNFEFEVPIEDKILLTERVKMAIKLLNEKLKN